MADADYDALVAGLAEDDALEAADEAGADAADGEADPGARPWAGR